MPLYLKKDILPWSRDSYSTRRSRVLYGSVISTCNYKTISHFDQDCPDVDAPVLVAADGHPHV